VTAFWAARIIAVDRTLRARRLQWTVHLIIERVLSSTRGFCVSKSVTSGRPCWPHVQTRTTTRPPAQITTAFIDIQPGRRSESDFRETLGPPPSRQRALDRRHQRNRSRSCNITFTIHCVLAVTGAVYFSVRTYYEVRTVSNRSSGRWCIFSLKFW